MKKRTVKNLKIISLSGFIGLTCILYSHKKDINMYLKFQPGIENLYEGSKSEKILSTLSEAMDENPFFGQEIPYGDTTEKEDFLEKFAPYIEQYGKYMDYETIITINEGLKTYKENSLIGNTLSSFYDTFYSAIKPNDKWCEGIVKSYATSVIKRYFGLGTIENEESLYELFEEITNILPSEEVAKYILGKDIEGLINALKEAYMLEDTKDLTTVVELFNKVNQEDIPRENLDKYKMMLYGLRNKFYQNKLQKDPSFKSTIHGQIIESSLKQTQNNLNQNDYNKLSKNHNGTINIKLASKRYGFLYMNEIEGTMKDSKINTDSLEFYYVQNYLKRCLTEKYYYDNKEYYFDHIWIVLSYIVDFNNLEEIDNKFFVRDIYPQLMPYFKTHQEIDEFIIALSNGNDKAYKKFFEIFTDKMTKEENPVKALAETKSLEEYYNSKVFFHYFNNDWESIYPDITHIKKNSKEAEKLTIIKEDYYFGEMNPMPYFVTIQKSIEEKTGCITNSNCSLYETRNWKTNEYRYKSSSLINVYSSKVNPIIKQEEGIYYAYYPIPKNYTDSSCVITYRNIENKLMEEAVNGTRTTMLNEKTNEYEEVYLVYSGKTIPKDKLKPVKFKTTLENLVDVVGYLDANDLSLTHKKTPENK